MKHLLFFIFSFLFAATAFSQRPDSATTYTWQNNAWQPEARFIYTYNSSCLTETLLTQEWLTDSSSWRNATLTTYAYNADDTVSQTTTQFWDTTSATWINALRSTYTYTTNKTISQFLLETWETNSWVNALRQLHSYNSNNLEDSVLSQSWLSNAWMDGSLTTSTYNADNTVNQVLSQSSLGVSWLNIARTTYAYNADKTVNNTITETWDLILSAWNNSVRVAFTYNAAKLVVTDTSQTWNSNQWTDSTLTINTYDVNNRLLNTLDQFWDDAQSLWVNDSQSNYTYNVDGTLAELVSQNWDAGTSAWINDTRFTSTYTTGCALPVTLLDFTASLNGKVAQLKWTTVTEINTKDFVVQRSADGRNFENIGTVNAVGNSTQKTSYQFTDAEVLSKGAPKIYYRLYMRDKDGRSAFSKIAIVNITPNGQLFVIYPNPVKDLLFATSSASFNNAEIKITDQSGKLVYSQQMRGVQAGIQNKVNVANLGKGVYYLQIVTGTDVQTTKFFKY
jgi:hypothetical protein